MQPKDQGVLRSVPVPSPWERSRVKVPQEITSILRLQGKDQIGLEMFSGEKHDFYV